MSSITRQQQFVFSKSGEDFQAAVNKLLDEGWLAYVPKPDPKPWRNPWRRRRSMTASYNAAGASATSISTDVLNAVVVAWVSTYQLGHVLVEQLLKLKT